MTSRREELASQINLVVAGEDFETGYYALMDVLAALTVYAAKAPEDYEDLVDRVFGDLKDYGRQHWDFFKAQHASTPNNPRGRA